MLLIPMVVAANASTWALRTVLDPGTFSTTVGRAMDTPTLERLLARALSDGIVERVERAPPQVVNEFARRVGLAAGAGSQELREALSERIVNAMGDPAVERVRDDAIASIHGYIVRAVEGEPGLVSVQGRNVVLDTTLILDRIERDAGPLVGALVVDIPASLKGPVVVAQVAELEAVGDVLSVMAVLRLLLPLVAATAALLIVLLAHRRARALGIVGVALVIGGLLSIIVVWSAGLYVSGVPDAQVARQLTREVYGALFDVLVAQSLIVAALGLALAVIAWYVGIHDRRRATERMLGPRY